jgi:putative tricarboxylic transport membrane protein
MFAHRVWSALPYAVLLALAGWFYRIAGQITYHHQGDNLGPDFWPRMALAAMMIICLIQGARLLIVGRAGEETPVIGAGAEEEGEAPRSHLLLGLGVLLTVGYGAFVSILGFAIATFLFMALFMYGGGYRRHLTIWLSSLIGTVTLVLVFQKVVYVSLPRGTAPFDKVADLLLSLF